MMQSVAQRHRQKFEAMEHNQKGRDAAQSTAWERIYHRFRHDLRRLADIQGTSRKIALKREILPEYQGWIDGVLAADSGRQDEVFTTCMIWLIDTGQVAEAIPLIRYVLRHGLAVSADTFRRTAPALVVEEISNPVLTALKVGEPPAVPVSLLAEIDRLTGDHDMPDQVRAKLYKALGLMLAQSTEGDRPQALDYLVRATKLNPDSGVKKEMDALRRTIGKTADPAADNEQDRK